jgi:hypothetical protein
MDYLLEYQSDEYAGHGTIGYKIGAEWLEGESAVYLRTQLACLCLGRAAQRHQ